MNGDQFKRRARAVAIGESIEETRRRMAERLLIAAAMGAAILQGAWFLHYTLRSVQP